MKELLILKKDLRIAKTQEILKKEEGILPIIIHQESKAKYLYKLQIKVENRFWLKLKNNFQQLKRNTLRYKASFKQQRNRETAFKAK